MSKNPLLAKPLLAAELGRKLQRYRFRGLGLLGIQSNSHRDAFVAQMLDSISRIEYVKAIARRPVSPKRLNPKNTTMFDPLRAAIHYKQLGNLDEAFWLVFLFVHCGKHLRKGYALLRMVYGALDDNFVWTWARITQNPNDFSMWHGQYLEEMLRRRSEFPFGNHRKYESLKELSLVFSSYVEWVGENHSHQERIDAEKAKVGDDPKALFNRMYKSMDAVSQFGRTAKFDYLTMVGKIGLLDIAPPIAYMQDGTGPVRGARLLFSGAVDDETLSKKTIEQLCVELEAVLGVGMQVMEDSLCNWQKSQSAYLPFRG
ncbi:alpha-glutamyl/putrescinyl thymine pyrophosphorylase clade 3 protein [Robbsia andropogonis]|uniref:alpha-glutamyl/putrescinyl thymine pyrophosphorylase clade 3 protein n=1 Tax=Robbsia andropogonis TaxID=28092 RepID=UPI000464944E|nr:hypothetical protein [Robbsia andropogonis]